MVKAAALSLLIAAEELKLAWFAEEPVPGALKNSPLVPAGQKA